MSNENYPCAYENKLTCFNSKSINLKIQNGKDEIRKDFILEEKKIIKIWGHIIDDRRNPVEGIIVNLLKPQYTNKKIEYVKVDSVLSDCDGFYQFELKESYKDINYLVSIKDNY